MKTILTLSLLGLMALSANALENNVVL